MSAAAFPSSHPADRRHERQIERRRAETPQIARFHQHRFPVRQIVIRQRMPLVSEARRKHGAAHLRCSRHVDRTPVEGCAKAARCAEHLPVNRVVDHSHHRHEITIRQRDTDRKQRGCCWRNWSSRQSDRRTRRTRRRHSPRPRLPRS